jgi:esterase/lipase superfamily enzyme
VWERPDPNKFMAITDVHEIADRKSAMDTLRSMVGRSAGRQALVFIHGFNVGFDEAALRTAQLTRDIGFDGAPILFSWPSKNAIYRYTADANEIAESSQNLARFLEEVQRVTGAKRVHVIAHSMGADITMRALASMRQTHPDTVFGQVAFAAADIKVSLFESLLPNVSRIARHVTLYASDHDRALKASHLFWSGRRAGESKPQIVLAKRMDSIDASRTSTDLLGHGYYASNRAMVDDVLALLDGVRAGDKARRLAPQTQPPSTWWLIP